MAAQLKITVGSSPVTANATEQALRLIKAALLYGDHVSIISPVASMANGVVGIGKLNLDQLMDLFIEVASLSGTSEFDNIEAKYKVYKAFKRQRGNKTKAMLLEELRYRELVRKMVHSELPTVIEQISVTYGLSEMQLAIDAGLLRLEPLNSAGGERYSYDSNESWIES